MLIRINGSLLMPSWHIRLVVSPHVGLDFAQAGGRILQTGLEGWVEASGPRAHGSECACPSRNATVESEQLLP